jgi:LuxR family maltose regulon positive regulatory protein
LGRAADNVWMVVRAVCDLADLEIIRGQLRRAADLCHEAVQESEDRGARQLGTVGYALVKLGEILYQRDELIAARDRAQEGVALMQGWRQPYEMVTGYAALAAVLQAQSDAPGAREALQHAEAIRSRHPQYHKLNSMVDGCRVRLRLAQDGPDAAMHLAREIRLGQAGALIFREQEQIILARVLLARQQPDEALSLLASLAREAEAGERLGRLVEVLALQALAWQARGEVPEAFAALEKALALGEAEGYVRAFVDGGAPMADLLQQVAARGPAGRGYAAEYVRRLLAALGAEDAEPAAAAAPPGAGSLVEPLTARELEVLQLLAEGRSNREIAEALVITLNGVKKHNSNIYGKLGVHSRTQAVVRAQELGLL